MLATVGSWRLSPKMNVIFRTTKPPSVEGLQRPEMRAEIADAAKVKGVPAGPYSR
jgi:hypothetical protein